MCEHNATPNPVEPAVFHPPALDVPAAPTGSRHHPFSEADIAKFNALLDENAVLARELARVQERSTRLLDEKSHELAQLSQLHLRAQADNTAKDSRQQELDRQNQFLRHRLGVTLKALETLTAESLGGAKTEPRVSPVTLYLNQKNVLCVGGRSGNVASYRDVVERVGGRFAHHDGSLEDSHFVLDASLAAADLVICQTGCISHNAYWKVKDFCKRTGKRCVFVENPSTSSLERGLEQMSWG